MTSRPSRRRRSSGNDAFVQLRGRQTPRVGEAEQRVIAEFEDLKGKLRALLREPRRWDGSLRRVAMARAILGSNTIEGYDVPLAMTLAVELGEGPLDADQATALALK